MKLFIVINVYIMNETLIIHMNVLQLTYAEIKLGLQDTQDHQHQAHKTNAINFSRRSKEYNSTEFYENCS